MSEWVESNTFQTVQYVSESLAAYGWYALGGVIAFLCAASYLRPVLDKWRQAREDAAYHKDPDRVAKRLEAEQRARELQQQQLAAASARALELQKEREEKKRAEAVERMARYGPSAGGQRLGSKGDVMTKGVPRSSLESAKGRSNLRVNRGRIVHAIFSQD